MCILRVVSPLPPRAEKTTTWGCGGVSRCCTEVIVFKLLSSTRGLVQDELQLSQEQMNAVTEMYTDSNESLQARSEECTSAVEELHEVTSEPPLPLPGRPVARPSFSSGA